MKQVIQQKLSEIEKEEKIKILLAVESGSRAWGFASPDSDYDVRFIYMRTERDYLRLEKIRDVIELPINDELDINGWDLQKSLRLLHKSNPTLFEWFSSPIIYLETKFAADFRSLMMDYFSSKKSLYHYISMAEGNYRDYFKGDLVKAKKYFYVLRPILACKWVLDKGTPPPMLFSELAAAELPIHLKAEVDRLLNLKINSPEVKEIPKIDILNTFIEAELSGIKSKVCEYGKTHDADWEKLNLFFWNTIHDDSLKNS